MNPAAMPRDFTRHFVRFTLGRLRLAIGNFFLQLYYTSILKFIWNMCRCIIRQFYKLKQKHLIIF